MEGSLEGKHIVVIGASSGIGKETAKLCASEGAKVSLCARRYNILEEVVQGLGEAHGAYELDVTWERSQIEVVFDHMVEERGTIDGMVYCAGVSANMAFSVISKERFQSVINTNLIGAMVTTQATIHLKRVSKKGCSIVWIASVAASKPSGGGLFMYSATKAGMIGAIRSLSIEIVKRNIRVNTISPGAVETEIWQQYVLSQQQKEAIFKKHPLGLGKPHDIAAGCGYLLSEDARWITGQNFIIDGGFSLA